MNVFNHIAGGVLMGLANLVPGISGGTMLLAAGVYRSLIDAVGELCRSTSPNEAGPRGVDCHPGSRDHRRLAGIVGGLVLNHRPLRDLHRTDPRWGAPPLRQLPKWTPGAKAEWSSASWRWAAWPFLRVWAVLPPPVDGSWRRWLVLGGRPSPARAFRRFVLLLLGQYVVILSVDAFKDGINLGSVDAACLPSSPAAFGVGFALGIAVTAVIMRTLLHKHESATTGVLLGLLLGAVLGLWPFRVGVPPEVGDVIRGQTLITVEHRDEVKPKYWRTAAFTPNPQEIVMATMAAAIGFGTALGVGRLDRQPEPTHPDS